MFEIKKIEGPAALDLEVYVNEERIAFLNAELSGTRIYIFEVFVSPEYRGLGIATSLYEEVKNWGWVKGANRVSGGMAKDDSSGKFLAFGPRCKVFGIPDKDYILDEEMGIRQVEHVLTTMKGVTMEKLDVSGILAGLLSDSLAMDVVKVVKSLPTQGTMFLLGATADQEGNVLPFDESVLFGTVLDPRAKTLEISIAGTTLLLPGLGSRKITNVYQKIDDEKYLQYGVRMGSRLYNLCNSMVGSTVAYSAQFKEALISEIQSFFKSSVMKRKTGLPALYWAWGQFSAVPDDYIGMDVAVAQKFMKAILKEAKKQGLSVEDIAIASRSRNDLLEGIELMGIRHPATGPNSTDPMKVRIVDALTPAIGVNQATAEKRGGDHDFDTFLAGLGQNVCKLEDALTQIRKNMDSLPRVIGPAILPLAPRNYAFGLRNVGFDGHFEDSDTAFLSAVSGESKALVGRFKTSLYWALEGILLSEATTEEIVELAKTSSDPYVQGALEVYNTDPSDVNFSALLLRTHYAPAFPIEERIMDDSKRTVDPVSLKMVGAKGYSAKHAIEAAAKNGMMPFSEMEEEGVDTGALRLATSLGYTVLTSLRTGNEYVGYSPKTVLEHSNPVFSKLIMSRGEWMNAGNPARILDLLSFRLDDISKAFIRSGDNNTSYRTGRPNYAEMEESAKVETELVTGDVLPYERGMMSITAEVVSGETEDGYPALFLSVGGIKILIGEYVVEKSGLGHVITSPSGVVYYAMPHIQALEGSPFPELSLVKQGYTGQVTVVRCNFWVRSSQVASDAFEKAEYRQARMAAKAVKDFIHSLPRITTDSGIEYLGEQVVVDVPLVEGDLTLIRRHVQKTLEANGFDLRATAHAKRGERVGRIREFGMSYLQGSLGFGAVANKNRISKMDSTIINHREFLSPRKSKTPKEISVSGVTSAVVVLVDSDRFGAKASDETYRTIHGDNVLAANDVQYTEVSEEEFLLWKEEYVEEPEISSLAKVKRQSLGGGMYEETYHIPVSTPGASRDMRKLLLGYRPGISQPCEDRLVVAFVSDIKGKVDVAGMVKRGEMMIVDIIDNVHAVQKKRAFDQVMRMVNSQLKNPLDPRGLTPEQIICRERAMRSVRGEEVAVGEFSDFVGELEKALISEGKDPSGHMYLYRVTSHENSYYVLPILEDGKHVTCIAGHEDVMAPCYEAGPGSYGRVRMDGMPMDPHLRTLSREGFNFTKEEQDIVDNYSLALQELGNMVEPQARR